MLTLRESWPNFLRIKEESRRCRTLSLMRAAASERSMRWSARRSNVCGASRSKLMECSMFPDKSVLEQIVAATPLKREIKPANESLFLTMVGANIDM